MAETIRDQRGWLWADIVHDLQTQGGLEGATINPLSVRPGQCGGTYQEGKFFLTWDPKHYLLLSMTNDDSRLKDLVGAFSKVLEYSPFCKYRDGQIFTYEWDKVNPNGRFDELSRQPNIADLVRI